MKRRAALAALLGGGAVLTSAAPAASASIDAVPGFLVWGAGGIWVGDEGAMATAGCAGGGRCPTWRAGCAGCRGRPEDNRPAVAKGHAGATHIVTSSQVW